MYSGSWVVEVLYVAYGKAVDVGVMFVWCWVGG